MTESSESDVYDNIADDTEDNESNPELTDYLNILEGLRNYASILKLEKLPNKDVTNTSVEATQQQEEVERLFCQAIILIKKNDDYINYPDKLWKLSLIELAAILNNNKIIKYLLKNHLKKLKDDSRALCEAIRCEAIFDHIDGLKLLLDTQVVLKTLLEKPESLGDAIYWAATKGHYKALKLLLDKPGVLDAVIKECPEKLGWAIYWAATDGHDRALAILLNNPAVLKIVIDKHPYQLGLAIKDAAEDGHLDALKLLLSLDLGTTFFSQFQDYLDWNAVLNDIAAKHGRNSDIYKIVALYIDLHNKTKQDLAPDELKEMIQLAYEHNLYTILVTIKDKYEPTLELINKAVKQFPKNVKNICKDILLQNTYQWKADNRMIYGKLIGFITTAKFDPYNYFTKLELDQIKQENNNKLENNLSVSKFLSAIKDKLQEEFKDYKSELNSLIGRIEKIEERIGLSQSSHVKMLNDSRDTKLYTDIIIEF